MTIVFFLFIFVFSRLYFCFYFLASDPLFGCREVCTPAVVVSKEKQKENIIVCQNLPQKILAQHFCFKKFIIGNSHGRAQWLQEC